MKLYVINDFEQKIPISVIARNRRELAYIIGTGFYIQGQYYTVDDVYAESSSNDTAGAALVGGLFGLLGGGWGVLAGGLIGGLIGKSKDDDDEFAVDNFNYSRL